MDTSFQSNYSDDEYPPSMSTSINAEYIADISNRMQMPDRIGVMGEQGERGLEDFEPDLERSVDEMRARMEKMTVPDTIRLAGSPEEAQADRNLNLDFTGIPHAPLPADAYVTLTTPPRTLTLDDRPFPTAGNRAEEMPQDGVYVSAAGHEARRDEFNFRSPPPYNDAMIDSLLADDGSKLSRVVVGLLHRVDRLERDLDQKNYYQFYFNVANIFFWVVSGFVLMRR